MIEKPRLSLDSALEVVSGVGLVLWGVASALTLEAAAIVAGGFLIIFGLFGGRLARWGS